MAASDECSSIMGKRLFIVLITLLMAHFLMMSYKFIRNFVL